MSAAGRCVQAYADYSDLMELTEQMISQMVLEIKGSYKIQYHADGPESDPIEIDFTPPWRRISMVDELEKVLEVTIPKDLYSEEARNFLEKLCADKNVECKPPRVLLCCGPLVRWLEVSLPGWWLRQQCVVCRQQRGCWTSWSGSIWRASS